MEGPDWSVVVCGEVVGGRKVFSPSGFLLHNTDVQHSMVVVAVEFITHTSWLLSLRQLCVVTLLPPIILCRTQPVVVQQNLLVQ